MKSLVVYYTRTGNTKKVANKIAEGLNSETEELMDKTNRSGFIGWLKSGYHATMKKTTELEEIKKIPSSYELVILGSPNWNKRMTPAIRTYINRYRNEFNEVALFCSAGGRGVQEMLYSMEDLCKKDSIAIMGFLKKDVEEKILDSKIAEFLDRIKTSMEKK